MAGACSVAQCSAIRCAVRASATAVASLEHVTADWHVPLQKRRVRRRGWRGLAIRASVTQSAFPSIKPYRHITDTWSATHRTPFMRLPEHERRQRTHAACIFLYVRSTLDTETRCRSIARRLGFALCSVGPDYPKAQMPGAPPPLPLSASEERIKALVEANDCQRNVLPCVCTPV